VPGYRCSPPEQRREGDVTTSISRYLYDPANLFTVLFDSMPAEPLLSGLVADWAKDGDFWYRSTEVAQKVPGRELSETEVRRAQNEDPRDLLAILYGLDAALIDVRKPYARSLVPDVQRAIVRYRGEHHSLSDEELGGALLPRFTNHRPGGNDLTLSALFKNVIRVAEGAWGKVSYKAIPDWVSGLDIRLANGDKPERIPVGVAAMLESPDDVHFKRVAELPPDIHHGGDSVDGYFPGPRDDEMTLHRMVRRIDTILRRLDDSGAVIGVLPHACLCDSLVESWKRALGESADRRTDGGSRLQWVLIGTGLLGDSPSPSRAIVLDGKGREVFSQDQVNARRLEPDTLAEWGLEDSGTAPRRAALQHMRAGKRIEVRDTDAGRVAILACEDLKQLPRTCEDLDTVGVSLILAPVFAEPMQEEQSSSRVAGEYCVDKLGAWIVVVNSLVVGRAQGLTGELSVFGLAGPTDAKVPAPSWTSASCTKPDEVRLLWLPVAPRFHDDETDPGPDRP
jgi:hypothetical protein